MLITIMTRTGETHIVHHTSNSGRFFRTFCSKTFSKNLNLITLAADNTFSGTCQTCKAYYDEMYVSDLNEIPAMARNQTQIKYYELLNYHRNGHAGPQFELEESIQNRWWGKLVKYQRLLQKRPYGQ